MLSNVFLSKRTMNNNCKVFIIGLFLTLLFMILFEGCASAVSTQYHRQHPVKGELVWAYDEGLLVLKDSVKVCTDNWDGLSEGVSCIPESKMLATSAKSDRTTGVFLEGAGWSVMYGGFILGFLTLEKDIDEHGIATSSGADRARSIILGGEIIGYGILTWGMHLFSHGNAEAIDAVNIYNLNFQKHPECMSDSTNSSHNNKNVK